MSILTETAEQTTRRLQLLGIAPEVIAPLIDYVNALNELQYHKALWQYPHLFGFEDRPANPKITDLAEWFDVDPAATGAGKYVQVVVSGKDERTGETRSRSVHSVVIKVTGEVCKAAGWKGGPAKSTSKARKGQPIVAYTLTDPDSFQAMLSRMDPHGGYLYSR